MHAIDDMALLIAAVIAAHCPGTRARQAFVQACLGGDWTETKAMVEGMLVEPWRLIGYQERRLREFLELLQLGEGHDLRLATVALRRLGPHPSDGAALS